MNIIKKGKLIILNNYSFVIKKISGFSIVSTQKDNSSLHYLTIFFDGTKIDFYYDDKKTLENLYNKLIEIISDN